MISRRAFHLLVPGALLELCLPGSAQAAPAQELFTLARNKNANIVKYAARPSKDGRLAASNPIEAYWLMRAEDGRREELTWAERQLAYGFSVSQCTPEGCTLRLSACSDRAMQVRLANGRIQAQLQIARQPATLQRIFVQADEGALLPSVRYVELTGITANGKRVAERVEPRRVRRF